VTSQLAIMTQSGVDIASALSSLAAQSQRPALADVLHEVRDTVQAGSTLSNALREHTDVFQPSFVATVAAGEASGRMAEVLEQLSQMQRSEVRSSRAIRSLLTYPLLLMTVSGSVIGILILFVLPRFTDIFAQYDVPLPIMTQILIEFANQLQTYWWLWVPLAVATVVGLLSWRTTRGGRHLLDQFWIHGPLVGEACRTLLVGRTCRLMGLMLENGVPLLESLQLTRQAIGNTLYKNLLAELQEAVVNGRSLASVLQETTILPPSAIEMIVTAESTGNLNEVTRLLGEYYEEEAEAKMRQLVGMLEPIITVGMGIVVATIVLSVMLPIFDLSTFAQR